MTRCFLPVSQSPIHEVGLAPMPADYNLVRRCSCGTFDRVWHKSLFSTLPCFGFYPFLCTLISGFLSGWSTSAIVNGHCSTAKPINSGAPQGSVLSPTLFLLFINDLSITNCPLNSYADDPILYCSTSFNRRPTQQQPHNSRLDATRRLTSDLSIISEWDKRNLHLPASSLQEPCLVVLIGWRFGWVAGIFVAWVL